MPDEPLLTLREVANQLGLPESTVRYYRDAFLDHIPSIGMGRRRRYPPPALAVLRTIAEGYGAGRSRSAILGTLDGATPRPPAAERPQAAERAGDGVTNLELLAAIVDGEREQRDALWQMAREIVRLTDVLESQEKVLTEIADHAGVRPALAAAQPPRALGDGRVEPAARTEAVPPFEAAPLPPPPAEPVFRAESPDPPQPSPAAAPAVRAPAPGAGPSAAAAAARTPAGGAPGSEMERLRSELESERQLVERLRESKLKLEHRVSDAEAALEEQRPRRRPSMLGRLLGQGDE